MGQYYTAIFLKPREENKPDEIREAYYPHDCMSETSPYGEGAKLMESSYIGNEFDEFVEERLINNPQRVVWAGDYADEEPDGKNLYDKANAFRKTIKVEFGTHMFLKETYVVNHDKKQYYERPESNGEEHVVNPLPILTCEGNGRGGGDYHVTNKAEEELVGSWARDTIEIKYGKPEDYTEIHPNFSVDW